MAFRIEDSTGKFIEATEDAAEVLKGLISSLKGGVGKASKIGGEDVVGKIIDLTKSNEKDTEKLRKAIEELPKELVNTFIKEIGDIGELLEDIRDLNKEIQKKRSGDGGLDKKDLSPMEKMMSAVKTATEKTERIFGKKGSGYTHDVYLEKLLTQTNSILIEIGKIINAKNNGNNLLGGGNSNGNLLGGGNGGGGIMPIDRSSYLLGFEDDIAKNIEQTSNGFQSLNEHAHEMVRHLNRIHRDTNFWATDLKVIADAGSYISSEMDKQSKRLDEDSDEYLKILKQREREVEIIESVASAWKSLKTEEKATLRGMIRNLQNLQKTGATAEQVKKSYEQIVEVTKKIEKRHAALAASLGTIGSSIKHVAGEIGGISSGLMGVNFLKGIFGDIKESVEQLNQETGLMRSLMTDKSWAGPGEYFNKMLDVSVELRQQIGQAPALIRRAWVTNLKRGSRNLEDMKASLNDGLALATQIGSSAEATASEFHDWNLELGLSGRQTSVLARTARQTSSIIGVWGDDMLKVVSATKMLVKEMRNVGLNVDQVQGGIMRMVGETGKLGLDQQAAELIKATSSMEGYFGSSMEMKNLIALSGQAPRVVAGEAMTDESAQKTTMLGISNTLKDEFKKMGAVNAQGDVDTSKLTPSQITQMDLIMRKRFGKNMGVGESMNMIKSLEGAFLPIDDKIEKLNKEMTTNVNLTEGEKKIMEDQLKALQEKKKQEKNTILVNAVDRMNEAMKNASSSEEAIKAMQNTLEKESKNAQARGITMSTDISRSMEDTISSVNEKLSKAGKDQLNQQDLMMKFQKAKENNDIAGIRSVMQQISTADQTASTQLKEQGDVLSKAQGSQQDMQARIQNLMGSAVQLLGFLPISVIWLSAIAASLFGLRQIKTLMRSVTSGLDQSNGVLGKVKMYGMKTYEMFNKRGSGYTHDIYVVTELKKVQKLLSRGGSNKLAEKHDRKMMLHDRKMVKSDLKDNKTKDSLLKREGNILDKASKGNKGGAKASGNVKGKGGLLDMIEEKMEMPSFEMPSNMKKLGVDLLKGAVGLALLVTGIVALAAVIMEIAGAIVKFSGLTVDKAINIGKTTAAILIAAGLIAAAVVGAAYGLKLLNEMRQFISIKDVYTGAITLLILTPAMMLLGLAIVGMGALLSLLISAEQAGKIALGVASIMVAAGLISLAVIGSAGALMLLGLVVTSSGGYGLLAMAALMLVGAAALLVLTPAMMLMAFAILALSKAVVSMIDVGWAEGVAKSVSSIMLSAGTIAGAVLLGAAAMVGLGLMSAFVGIIYPFMMAGAFALMLLTPAMIKLAHAVIWISKGVSSGIDVNWASSVSEKVASIMWSAMKISAAVLGMVAILVVLGALILFVSIAVPLLFAGAAALLILTPAMLVMARAIIWLSSKMMAGVDLGAAAATAKTVGDFMSATKTVILSILEMSVIAALLGAMISYAPIMAISMILGAGTLLILTSAIVKFGRAVMNAGSRLASEIDLSQMDNARKALEGIASMVVSFGTTIEVLVNSILPMVQSSMWSTLMGRKSVGEKIVSAIAPFSRMIGAVGYFFHGIMSALSIIPDDKQVKDILGRVTGMTEVMGSLDPVLNKLAEVTQKWMSGWFWFSPLGDLYSKAKDFGYFFTGIGHALKTGMIDPVRNNFPDTAEVDAVTDTLRSLTESMNALTETLMALADVTSTMSGLKLDPIKIQEVRGVLDALASQNGNVTMPISTTVTGGGMSGESPFEKKQETWWESMLGVLTGVGSPQTSSSSGLGRIMKGSMEQSVGDPMTKMGSGIETIGTKNNDLASVFQASNLALGESIVNAINLQKVETITAIRAIPIGGSATAGMPQGQATAANPKPTTGKANPMGGNLEEQVETRVQNSKPSGAMAAMNEELVKISTNTEMLVELANERNELLEKILERFDSDIPSGSGGNDGETSTMLNAKPRGTPNYYQWRQARYGDGPTKQYNNPGT